LFSRATFYSPPRLEICRMLATVHPDREARRPAPERAGTLTPSRPPVERHGYAPGPENRIFGLAGTGLVSAALLAALFLTFEHHVIAPPPSAPLVVDLLPLASPHARKQVKENLVLEKKQVRQPTPARVDPVPKAIVPPPVAVPAPPPIPESSSTPAPKIVEEAAPRAITAPPAPQVSSNANDTSWQGRVLARLGQYRHYPSGAQRRHEQGVPYIRFVMDRDGKILSSRLEHSSGSPDLDREAVSLPKRAQPFPKPPAEVTGDTIELVVPVEFVMR
jgi:protein TonB